MQVKKDGKVDHSSNTHDDNIFSYLMAMYVWYEGVDLVEKFGIYKNTIKTDEDVEIADGSIEDALEKKEKLDLHELEYDTDEDPNDLNSAYRFLEESSNFKTTKQLHDETFLADMQHRDELLMYNVAARESYCKNAGIDPNTFSVNTPGIDSNIVTLPDTLFGGVDTDSSEFDMFGDNSNIFDPNMKNGPSPLKGNLSGFWNRI